MGTTLRALRPALWLLSAVVAASCAVASADPPAVPPGNRANLTTPPPRPPTGDAAERARRLFEAIRADRPDDVVDFFLPREAFRQIKAIREPDRRYDVLLAAYREDVHELHEQLPGIARAEFVRLNHVRRGGWVVVGEEGNRLPYWVSRHSTIEYRVDGRLRSFEVRVLIAWDERWYVTHLNEFH